MMMKRNRTNIKLVISVLLVALLGLNNSLITAQNKKHKARLKVAYFNDNGNTLLKISAKYKEHKKYKLAIGLDVNIYNLQEDDSLVLVGKSILNNQGIAFFNLSQIINKNQPSYTFKIVHKNSKKFKKVAKSLTIKIAYLQAKLKIENKKPTIIAYLKDFNQNPVSGVELKVNLQRYFAPLPVGNSGYFTDDNGMIVVPITRKMPGLNKKLNYEVVLEDNDDYGNIKTVVPTNIGLPIKDLSTFDQRTMWSPPSMAPWTAIIIPNLIILFVWSFLFILMFNLYRISKFKNN